MQEIDDTASERMGNLNNAVVALIDTSTCTTLEVITVLRLIVQRLDKAFETSVMESPIKTIADKVDKVKDGSNVEKTGV
jgi:hypothetical protein